MLIYIIFFLLSFLFIYLSNKYENKKKFFVFLALFLLSFLAAIRDSSVGTDVNYYVKPIFINSVKYGFFEHYALETKEIGYLFFNYIISLFTSNFNIYLFFMQFFMLFFAYKGLNYINPKHKTLIFIIYVFLYYNRSLNVIRQSMALGLVLVSLKYIFNNNPKKFICIIFLAFLFHKSALVFLIAYPLYKLLGSSNKNSYYILILFLVFSFLFIFNFKDILLFLVNINVLPTRFVKYTTIYFNEVIDFELADLLIDIALIIIYFFFNKLIKKKYPHATFFFFFLLIDLLCNIVGGSYTVVNRIGLYFRIPAELFFFSCFDSFLKEENGKNVFSSLFSIIIIVAYWVYLYGYRHVGRTIPFIVDGSLLEFFK